MTNPERVAFLMGPDAVAALDSYEPDGEARAALVTAALGEYTDPRLAAAYVLDLLCDDQRVKAAATAVAAKKIKVGAIEIEKAASSGTSAGVLADALCARARALRREYRAGTGGITFASPVQVTR
ncbi:hypothetical protein [Deinococcus yunweiensis]|uniref:hypothetical protein n=1 Tax=Deinococcus yunweiensis TaxID=367282 RepID=UPI00398EF396